MKAFEEYSLFANEIKEAFPDFTVICGKLDDKAFMSIEDHSLFLGEINDDVETLNIENIRFKLGYDESAKFVLMVEDFANRNRDFSITCPLCGDRAEYRHDKAKTVHAWVCVECPFVGMEYYDGNSYNGLRAVVMGEVE